MLADHAIIGMQASYRHAGSLKAWWQIIGRQSNLFLVAKNNPDMLTDYRHDCNYRHAGKL
jgi:hypothetical protein